MDLNRNEIFNYRLLVSGDHFGAIASVYDCKRTATVMSRNYNIMANINRQRFMDLCNDIPGYKNLMLRHIYKYHDPMKIFLKDSICKIPYFNKAVMNKHLFHRILYSFEHKFFE